LKRSEREKAHQETEFIHHGEDGFMIVSPKTEFASKWWGKGTQWCTASEKNNMFQRYNKEAPLLIIIMPNGDKLQLHVRKDDIQFMDAQDREVEYQYIEDNWNVLEAILLSAIKQNVKALYYVPWKLRDKEICRKAVNQDGRALKGVPQKYLDKEICLEAVRQNGWALQFVTTELRDKDMCMEAVRQNGMALYYVPEEFRDRSLYLKAVRQNGMALRYVPEELLDREICLEAVKQNGDAFIDVPLRYRDKEMCLEAVRQNSRALFNIPEELRDKEICMEAVKQNAIPLINQSTRSDTLIEKHNLCGGRRSAAVCRVGSAPPALCPPSDPPESASFVGSIG
jgi:hypothetical protein